MLRDTHHASAKSAPYDLRFKDSVALRTTGGAGGDIGAAFGTGEGELRAAHGALHGVFAGGRSAFGADGLIAVRAVIGAIG